MINDCNDPLYASEDDFHASCTIECIRFREKVKFLKKNDNFFTNFTIFTLHVENDENSPTQKVDQLYT